MDLILNEIKELCIKENITLEQALLNAIILLQIKTNKKLDNMIDILDELIQTVSGR